MKKKRRLKMDERNVRRRELYAERQFEKAVEERRAADNARWIATHEIATSR